MDNLGQTDLGIIAIEVTKLTDLAGDFHEGIWDKMTDLHDKLTDIHDVLARIAHALEQQVDIQRSHP